MEVETISEGKVLCMIMVCIKGKSGEALFLNISNRSISEGSTEQSHVMLTNISAILRYPSLGPRGKVHLDRPSAQVKGKIPQKLTSG